MLLLNNQSKKHKNDITKEAGCVFCFFDFNSFIENVKSPLLQLNMDIYSAR